LFNKKERGKEREKEMAKIMLVRCEEDIAFYFGQQRRHHIIVSEDYKEALAMLKRIGVDLLPDLAVVGNFSRTKSNPAESNNEKFDFVQKLKGTFPQVKVVLVDGKISPRRTPIRTDGVCPNIPEKILAAVSKVLLLVPPKRDSEKTSLVRLAEETLAKRKRKEKGK